MARFRYAYIVGEPVVVLDAVDIFPQHCFVLIARYSRSARCKVSGVYIRLTSWSALVSDHTLDCSSQDLQERYPSSGFKLSPKCRRAPCTSLENPMLLLLRCHTDYAERCRRLFDSRSKDLCAWAAMEGLVAGITATGCAGLQEVNVTICSYESGSCM
jgi:hypothetical protein